MRNNWLFPMDLDGWSPVEPLVHPHLLSHISSFFDNSIYHSRYFYVSGSMALREAFNCMSNFSGALLLWFASGSYSNANRNLPGNSHGSSTRSRKSYTQVNHITSAGHNLAGFGRNFRLKGDFVIPLIFDKILSFSVRQLCKQGEQLQSFPMLSLAAALIPPFDNESQNVLGAPVENDDILMHRCMDQNPCEVEHHGCGDLYFSNFDCTIRSVEPRTGIEFPTILDNILAGDSNSSWLSEVLVGTGSRTMKIIKIKSLNVYAFGFYVHPYDVCEKLGPKYASIPASEVNKHHTFYQDLLREDISMTIRLVVSVNGMKISTVRKLREISLIFYHTRSILAWLSLFDAFEKSLRARLMKTNPDTDYDCLRRFGSLFSQDIPIRAGTTIYFRRTADNHLITEIGGNQIGAVHSKDLCRAFFDMYIGDLPVCEQTKEEIGRNVASIIGRS